MSASLIFDIALLGAMIAYSDDAAAAGALHAEARGPGTRNGTGRLARAVAIDSR